MRESSRKKIDKQTNPPPPFFFFRDFVASPEGASVAELTPGAKPLPLKGEDGSQGHGRTAVAGIKAMGGRPGTRPGA